MVQGTPPSETEYGERFVRRMLDERSFPEDVEQTALEHLTNGETEEALQLLIKSHIARDETTS